ncbi:hypothetical protein QU870_25140 [Escherichia coli]|nr:hypothetical protein [Escherichia coli]
MKSLTTETALDILIAWLQDNIDCESGIIFDNDEDKTDSAALLPCQPFGNVQIMGNERKQADWHKLRSDQHKHAKRHGEYAAPVCMRFSV